MPTANPYPLLFTSISYGPMPKWSSSWLYFTLQAPFENRLHSFYFSSAVLMNAFRNSIIMPHRLDHISDCFSLASWGNNLSTMRFGLISRTLTRTFKWLHAVRSQIDRETPIIGIFAPRLRFSSRVPSLIRLPTLQSHPHSFTSFLHYKNFFSFFKHISLAQMIFLF